MFVNNFKVNVTTITNTATTINIPIDMEFQLVDQAELVDRVFVDVETEKNINPIIDYEKAKFIPVNLKNTPINKIIYKVSLLNGNTYGAIGFSDDDIKFRKENFKRSFLELNFYDSDNPLTQNFVTSITLFPRITSSDLEPSNSTTGTPGQPKPANQIPITYTLESPLINPKGFSEGYHIYDYKDEVQIGQPKYLYMRARFKNAKDGKTTNMMVKQQPKPIDLLVHELYTRYILIKAETGYYYRIDNQYQGNGPSIAPNNVTYQQASTNTNIIVDLYQINAL
jgi:hypothetical protein